ncbi:MAG: AAA family ATPase [Streptococcus sp.]|nr:AAA family ATPase [Streptococcus sp.]
MSGNPALTRFVAFYSYKGGVGRTLALANCARVLAAGGKQVLLMDFDLEAPGLQHFEVFRPKKAKEDTALSGFSEYLEECLKNGPPSALTSYIHESQGHKVDKGKIWLMPAGRHEEPGYLSFLNGKSWSDFYSLQEGYKILENLRGQIVEEYRPDYVLMDARTGLSEIGGIATHQLADIVVLVFNLNAQNLAGALRVFKSLQTAPMNPKIILVASPVPVVPVEKGTPFEKKIKQIIKDFQGAYNADKPLIIPYHPMLAFSERILADDHDDPFSSDAPYRQLTDLIKELAKDADIYLAKANEARRKGDLLKAKNYLSEGLTHNPKNSKLLFLLFSLAGQYYFESKYQESVDICSLILQNIGETKQPSLQIIEARVLFNKGVALANLKHQEEALTSSKQVLARFGNSKHPELQKVLADTLLFQGDMLLRLNKNEDALATYEQLLTKFIDHNQPELENSVASALTRKLSILVEMRRHEEVLLTAEQFLTRFGNSQRPVLQKQIGKVMVNQGCAFIILAKQEKLAEKPELFLEHVEQANTALEKAKQYLDEDAILLQNQAYLLFLRGEREAAVPLLKQAIKLNKNQIIKGCHKDSKTHTLPEDDDFLKLVDKLASEHES